MLEIINGDIFDSKEKYLLHQTNCVSNRAVGLAKDIFDKYPYADIYTHRKEHSKPGTIEISGNGQEKRYIIGLYAQYYPGKPKYPDSNLDGFLVREKYFHKCLLKIAKIENLESVALPWRIGCGLGGCDWSHHLVTINNFAHYIYSTQGAKTFIYRKENAE